MLRAIHFLCRSDLIRCVGWSAESPRLSLALLSPGAEVPESPRLLLLALLSPGAEVPSYQCEANGREQRHHQLILHKALGIFFLLHFA